MPVYVGAPVGSHVTSPAFRRNSAARRHFATEGTTRRCFSRSNQPTSSAMAPHEVTNWPGLSSVPVAVLPGALAVRVAPGLAGEDDCNPVPLRKPLHVHRSLAHALVERQVLCARAEQPEVVDRRDAWWPVKDRGGLQHRGIQVSDPALATVNEHQIARKSV